MTFKLRMSFMKDSEKVEIHEFRFHVRPFSSHILKAMNFTKSIDCQ